MIIDAVPSSATSDEHAQPLRRDAARTRHLLVEAARKRFAHDGFPNTTVRDITRDAGVNVALVNRYFTSKEGLFTACLQGAVDELEQTVHDRIPLDEVAGAIAHQLGSPDSKDQDGLLLLLQSSGDAGAESIRLEVLRSFADRLAASVGTQIDTDLMLRAQVVLAAALGMALLRSSAALEPLSSADAVALLPPLHALIQALLGK